MINQKGQFNFKCYWLLKWLISVFLPRVNCDICCPVLHIVLCYVYLIFANNKIKTLSNMALKAAK